MALKRIVLRDFVIVEELEIELQEGFTALTGETGAGKSILIDAVQLALGARAEASFVREGAAKADICATFDAQPALLGMLERMGIEGQEEVLLRRVIDAQGKSRAWINGTPATASQLREVGESLLEIHGQHAWQSLTRPESVRALLDAYAQNDTTALSVAWQSWRKSQQALHEARSAQTNLQQERERLLWQISEMDKLAPGPEEWDALNAQHTRLAHTQTLLDTASGALELLEADEGGLLSGLSRTQDRLQDQLAIEPGFREMADLLASSLAQAEEAAHALHTYLRRTELDPERLAELDQRLTAWMGLARRFRRPPQELPQLLASWKQELATLERASDLETLERQCDQHQALFMEEARKISKARLAAAPRLGQAITRAMQELGMKGGRFEVHLPAPAQPGPAGLEEVEFLVAGHAGATPRPVGKVASGGELSRIALAIAVTTSQLGQAQTLIFDEVDSGVGGAVAQTVGALMRQLGQDRQVLAVTHLAQVAACAHQHLVVTKSSQRKQTRSQVNAVTQQERVHEIARMIGGQAHSEASLAHAREMLAPPPAGRARRKA